MFLVGVALAAAWLFVVMYWWSEGVIDTSDAVLLVVVFGGLTFGMFAARALWQFLLALTPLVGAAGYAVYSYRIGSIRAYYRNKAEEYIQAIQADPRNRGARERLAETLYSLGELDRAIDEMQVVVDMGGEYESAYRLGKWVQERHLRDTVNPVCRWCRTENQLGSRVCSKCGADLPYESTVTRWLMSGRNASARSYLIIVVGVAIGCLSVLMLPTGYAFLVVSACLLSVVGWWMAASSRS